MILNREQLHGISEYKTGRNMFITGGAGVGKSCLTEEIIREALSENKNVMVTAPTGLAALNINGVTTHRAFEAPIGALTFSKKSYTANEELINTDIVIVEEISTCRLDLFDFLGTKILSANAIRKKYGKRVIQLIVVGDFFQLPPVTTTSEKFALDRYYKKDIGLGFAFSSKMWNIFEFKTVLLTEVMRQSDKYFIDNLNRIRTGSAGYITSIIDLASKEKMANAINLCGTRSEVNKINKKKLEEINTNEIVYNAVITGEANEQDVLAEFKLNVKEGARVMTLINKDGYRNGSYGTIKKCYSDAIVIVLDNGNEEIIRPYTWNVSKYTLELEKDGGIKLVKEDVGAVTQFPIRLAYAITIHKSQGQTFDRVNLTPYCWDCGQMYVALSRIRSIGNLYFTSKPDIKYLVTSLNVIKFYNDLNRVEEKVNENKVEEVEAVNENIVDMENILGKLMNL
jgi:ATP-dependent DNA helicase PIF1